MKKYIKLILVCLLLITLTGCSKKKQFVVSYLDGDTILLQLTVKKGELAKQTSAPDKENEVFDYWSYNDTAFDFSTPITENISLQAIYKTNYTVTFVVNQEASYIKVNPNETIELPIIDSTSTTFFIGWYLNDIIFDENTPITSNITLIARFQDYTPCTEVSFEQDEITIGKKETKTLAYSLTPTNTTDKITFSSSDPSIVSVSNQGVIKGLNIGSSVISATINNLQANIKINVVTDVETISIEKQITLDANQTYQLNPTILPSDSLNKTLTYTSSNPDIVSVDSNGLLHAHKGGQATITLKANNGTETSVVVNVNQTILSLIIDEVYKKENDIIFLYYDSNCTYNLKLEAIDWKDGQGETKILSLNDEGVTYESNLNLLTINQSTISMSNDITSQKNDVLTVHYDDQVCSINLVYEPKLVINAASSNLSSNGLDFYVTNTNIPTILEANVFGTFSIESDLSSRIQNFESLYSSCKFRYISIISDDETIITFVSKGGQTASISLHNAN